MSSTTHSSMKTSTETDRIGLKERIGYGSGDFASQLVFCAVASFLTIFYTDTMHISPFAVGTLMLVARIIDAFVDLSIGALVDKTHTRYGKARPWLLWMAAPFALSGVALFTIPHIGATGILVYVCISYLVMNILYSAINVPYGVLSTLVTQDAYQRSVLNVFRMVMSVFGQLVVTYFTVPLVRTFGNGQTGWIITFIILCSASLTVFLLTFSSTKERVRPSVVQKSIPLHRAVRALGKNKYWLIILFFALVYFANCGLGSGIIVYYAKYILRNEALVGVLGIALLVPNLIAYFTLPFFIKHFGKRNCAMVGCLIMISGALFTLINPSSLTIVLIGLCVKSTGMAPLMGTFFSMLGDTVEYGEWRTGMRTEGLVYSAGSFGTKAGLGFGTAILGWGLASGGFKGNSVNLSTTALGSIHFLFIGLPVILCAVQFLLLYAYKLDHIFPQIMQDLNRAREIGFTKPASQLKEES